MRRFSVWGEGGGGVGALHTSILIPFRESHGHHDDHDHGHHGHHAGHDQEYIDDHDHVYGCIPAY